MREGEKFLMDRKVKGFCFFFFFGFLFGVGKRENIEGRKLGVFFVWVESLGGPFSFSFGVFVGGFTKDEDEEEEEEEEKKGDI